MCFSDWAVAIPIPGASGLDSGIIGYPGPEGSASADIVQMRNVIWSLSACFFTCPGRSSLASFIRQKVKLTSVGKKRGKE